MATVYRAQDQVLDRTVAVKIMLPQYAGDATFAARFKQEAQAAAGLSSPYIVGVYDWGKDGDTYYIVMEYLRGTDLKSGIKSHGALDPKKVAQIGSQISSALSVAHKHEIIHRDIKPQNIMVLPDGNIKVMDFGIARAKNSHLTQDNNVLGTAHYVSPEQTRGQDLGPTSDIYSLGVVMYECATGRVPLTRRRHLGRTQAGQRVAYSAEPDQLRCRRDLERIILKCMEKDPANRFQTADELRQVLNSYLSGRAVNISEPTRIIGAPGELGATKTRELSDSTRAMVRPVSGVSGQTNPAAPSRVPPVPTRSISQVQQEQDYRRRSRRNRRGWRCGGLRHRALWGRAGYGADVLNKDQQTAIELIKEPALRSELSTRAITTMSTRARLPSRPPTATLRSPRLQGEPGDLQGPQASEKVEVPQLVGLTKDQAEAALASVGLKGNATEEANEADEGQVFEQGTDAARKSRRARPSRIRSPAVLTPPPSPI